jgi:hypothetical protein
MPARARIDLPQATSLHAEFEGYSPHCRRERLRPGRDDSSRLNFSTRLIATTIQTTLSM